MILPITVTRPSAFAAKLPPSVARLGDDELFLIELQGTLDVPDAAREGQLMGTLDTADMNKPVLVIGRHLIEGAVVDLPKPLGVLHKHVRSSTVSADGQHAGEGEEGEEGNGEVRWDVVAVVRKKIVFSKRPMPMPMPIATAKPASTASASRT